MLFMLKQVSLPKISSILQKMKICQNSIYALFAWRPSIVLIIHVSHTPLSCSLKCYARAERSHGNYSVHSEDLFLLRNLLCHCFSWTKSLQSEIGCFTFHFLSRIWISWSDLLGIYFGVISWVNWQKYLAIFVRATREFCRLPANNDSPACYGPHPTSHVVVRFIPCLFPNSQQLPFLE